MARSGLAFPPLLLAALLLAHLAGRCAVGRLISLPAEADASDPLASDGIPRRAAGVRGYGPFLDSCKPTYGFLPCITTAVGNLFLVLAYGFLMFKAATYLSFGSELLLQILGPGIVGGLFLPVLGALPDAMLILVSGLSGSKETAQNQVLIGMGLLAGSTVMLLTLLWGSCVVVGKHDLSENPTSQDNKGFDLFASGISTDVQTSYASRIMAISVIPFIIVQLPRVLKFPSGQHLAVLLALIVAVALLLSYCLYQVSQPWIQRRRLEYAKYNLVISGILRYSRMASLGHLTDKNGEVNIHVIQKLFRKIDLDGNQLISRSELRAFITGLQIDEINLDKDDADKAVDKVMNEFDTSHNHNIEEGEFINGISKWIDEAKHSVAFSGSCSKNLDQFDMIMQKARNEQNLLIDQSDEAAESIDSPAWTSFKAILFLILGTVVAAIFADPLVDAVDNFSIATKIPSFFISFIVMPLVTNSSEAVSAIIFASRKKQRTTSLTYSEIYGGVTMNNTLCLAVFLALVYTRQLAWDFSAEVLIILIVCVAMGVFASFRTTFPLWTCFAAFLLYPLSLVLVYVLDFIFGWS